MGSGESSTARNKAAPTFQVKTLEVCRRRSAQSPAAVLRYGLTHTAFLRARTVPPDSGQWYNYLSEVKTSSNDQQARYFLADLGFVSTKSVGGGRGVLKYVGWAKEGVGWREGLLSGSYSPFTTGFVFVFFPFYAENALAALHSFFTAIVQPAIQLPN